jgi:hypothetical protein
MSRRRPGVALAVAAALAALVAAPSASGVTGQSRPRAEAAEATSRLDPDAVWAVAQLCLDPRHAALVRSAQRHGRVFGGDEALGWCVA